MRHMIVLLVLLSVVAALPMGPVHEVEQLTAQEAMEARAQAMAQAQAFQQALRSSQPAFQATPQSSPALGEAQRTAGVGPKKAAVNVKAPPKVKLPAKKRKKATGSAKKPVANGKPSVAKKEVAARKASVRKATLKHTAAKKSGAASTSTVSAVKTAAQAMVEENNSIQHQLVRIGQNARSFKHEHEELAQRSQRLKIDIKALKALVPKAKEAFGSKNQLGEILSENPAAVTKAVHTAAAELNALEFDAKADIVEENAAKQMLKGYEQEAVHVMKALSHTSRPSTIVKRMTTDAQAMSKKVDPTLKHEIDKIIAVNGMRNELKENVKKERLKAREQYEKESKNVHQTRQLQKQAEVLEGIVKKAETHDKKPSHKAYKKLVHAKRMITKKAKVDKKQSKSTHITTKSTKQFVAHSKAEAASEALVHEAQEKEAQLEAKLKAHKEEKSLVKQAREKEEKLKEEENQDLLKAAAEKEAEVAKAGNQVAPSGSFKAIRTEVGESSGTGDELEEADKILTMLGKFEAQVKVMSGEAGAMAAANAAR